MIHNGCEYGRLPGPLGLCVEEELAGGTLVHTFDEPSPDEPASQPVQLVEPEPASGWTSDLRMRDFSDRPLIAENPIVTDVRQGYTGNCPVIATLAALAHATPGKIAGMVSRREADVSSRVWDTNEVNPVLEERPYKTRHLYEVAFQPDTPIQVSGLLWHRGDALEYGSSARDDLWPSILEKAFVVGHGGHSYQRIFGTVTPWEAMTTMLGSCKELELAKKPSGLKAVLRNARTRPTIAATFTDLPADVTVPMGIIGHHAYAVLSMPSDESVRVYNALDGAKIDVSLATFRKVFETVVQTN